MNTIHVLPPQLVARIAAGEVIERPAYAVKELVENALDAHATSIEIDVDRGGMASITVTDNGEGMSQGDVLISWHPHTTSKTDVDSDLTRIDTLGFRGEALASIAAVGRLVIQSRRAGDIGGTRLEVADGNYVGCVPVGMAPGTIVRVEDLFLGLPARHKFLSGATTEWHHISKIVEAFCLSYPSVRFVLRHNGKTMVDVSPQPMAERLASVVGADIMANIFPFSVEGAHFSVSGYLGKPQVSFEAHLTPHLIVNGRTVKNRKLVQTIAAAYRGLLMVDASPFFLLFITVPPESVDANIHPRKEEVRLLNEQEIHTGIYEGIRSVARSADMSFRWTTPAAGTDGYAASTVREGTRTSLSSISDTSCVMQLHNLYIIAQTPTGMIVIDQHAAHERILYERFLSRYEQLTGDPHPYTYPSPVEFSLPLSDRVLMETHMDTLVSAGFDIQASASGSFRIARVPHMYRDRDVAQLIRSVLHDMADGSRTPSADRKDNRMLSYLACRSAVKAGDPLTVEEMRTLIRELSGTTSSYTCPHGRPTHFQVSLPELEKMFGRS